MSGRAAAAWTLAVVMALGSPSVVRADGPSNAAAAQAFAEAEKTSSEKLRREHLRAALDAHAAGWSERQSWREAAGAMRAAELLGLPTLASAWYWVATDAADYSDEYVAWQARAVTIFDRAATLELDATAPPVSVAIDGEPLPEVKPAPRPLVVTPGSHTISATTATGATGTATVTVPPEPKPVKVRLEFVEPLAAGEKDPRDPVVGPPPPKVPSNDWQDPLFIATVVGTITLAAGIAVGGGYLLLGEDNPKSLDTAGGVALIVTELCLIGGGTALALLVE